MKKKKKKKKGFTLIELLAVILILGIISLIAIPVINTIVSEAKESATKRSAEQYIKAVGTTVVAQELKGNYMEGTYSIEDLNSIGVEVKGTKPTSGTVTIDNNEVIACSIVIGEYIVTCDDEAVVVNKILEEKVSPVLTIDNNSNGVADINDKVCIDTECFYVISNNGTKIRMLSEWNLNVGYDVEFLGEGSSIGIMDYDSQYEGYIMTNYTYTKLNPSIIKQDSTKKGSVSKKVSKGITSFAKYPSNKYNNDIYDLYWSNNENLLNKYGSSYPAYVYDSNSNLYPYINSYVGLLKGMTGLTNITGNLIAYDELISLGCDDDTGDCDTAPSYLMQTSYWTGTAYDYVEVYIVDAAGTYSYYANDFDYFGVRPVIEISSSSIK